MAGTHNISSLNTFNNTGTVNVTAGTLDIAGGFTQSGTINVVSGATFQKTAGFTNTGTIKGDGTIQVGTGAAALINQGIINPGGIGTTGTLTITGDLTMGAGGSLNAELNGTGAGSYDVLNVTGAATLTSGTLNLSGTGGAGTYPVLNATGGFGGTTFGTINSGSFTQTPTYSGTVLSLGVMANSGSSFSWDGGGSGGLWNDPLNWLSDTVPAANSSVTIGSGYATSYDIASLILSSLTIGTGSNLTIQSGKSLTLTGNATFDSAVSLSGTLQLNGGTTAFNASANGTGTLGIDGAAVNATATNLSVGALNLASGSLTGTGTLTVTNSFTRTGGTVGSTFTGLTITQASGTLSPGSWSVNGPVSLVASAGDINLSDNITSTSSYVGMQASQNLYIGTMSGAATVSGAGVKLQASYIKLGEPGYNAGTVSATSGNGISLIADTFYASTTPASSITSDSGISVQTLTNGRAIAVGDGATGAGLVLNNTAATLFNTPKLRIGNEDTSGTYGAFSGNITVTGSGTFAIDRSTLQLGLTTAGAISQDKPIKANGLRLISGISKDIDLQNTGNLVGALSAQSGGDFSFTNNQSILIDSFTGGTPAVTVSGIKTSGGNILLAALTGDITVNAPGIDACYGLSTGCTSTVTLSASAGSIYTPLIRTGSAVSLYAGTNVVDTDSALNNIVAHDGNPAGVTLNYTVGGTIELDAWGVTPGADNSAAVDNVRWAQPSPPPPPPPPPPTIDQCTADPTLAGCTAVLPTIDTCTTTPTAPGCTAVLPSIDVCTTTPTAPGCTAVLPTIATCTATPTAPGCSVVLPSMSTCTTAPTTPGCSVVLPTIATCTATPTAPGCSVVLPNMSTCTTAPTTPGCSVVLPSIATCTSNPTAPGCSVVLPSMSTCTTAPTTPGCSVVLPSIATCTSNPTAPGCSVVLPSMSTCTTAPTTPGCSVVLPTIATCTATPTAPGCSVVLPSLTSCITTPSAPGCSVVLPTIATCSSNPTIPGCSVVLPSLATCIASPGTIGCGAVLPSMNSCIAAPSTPGCAAVLPTLAECAGNPSAAGCIVVVPVAENKGLMPATNQTINIINQVPTTPITPAGLQLVATSHPNGSQGSSGGSGGSAGQGGSSDGGNNSDKDDKDKDKLNNQGQEAAPPQGGGGATVPGRLPPCPI
jgi:hypothetical protein